jgi:hypothetical protein
MNSYLRNGALLAAAALAGGVSAYGVDSTHPVTRTIVRTTTATDAVSAPPQTGLSVNQIYKKDAPGVVVVTATSTTTTQNPFDPFGAPQSTSSRRSAPAS